MCQSSRLSNVYALFLLLTLKKPYKYWLFIIENGSSKARKRWNWDDLHKASQQSKSLQLSQQSNQSPSLLSKAQGKRKCEEDDSDNKNLNTTKLENTPDDN